MDPIKRHYSVTIECTVNHVDHAKIAEEVELIT